MEKDFQELTEKLNKSESNLKIAVAEVIGLRKRIDKLKQSNSKHFDQKICRNCGKEYSDKANFNWSCRTHKSTFGGEIWWCCGRKSREDPGCRFGKHEPKDDNTTSNPN